VIEHQTGFLVDEGDIEAMAQCMSRLAKESELAEEMGNAARERICAEFSRDKSINNLWHIVQMTIERSRKW
jgi:glycosyltransferase involved in cell wall biosynthesis